MYGRTYPKICYAEYPIGKDNPLRELLKIVGNGAWRFKM
jgi:hypothetical protein